jgi:predicted metal-binding protein
MCPPYVGELDELRAKLGGYRRGLLLRYTNALDVPVQREAVEKTKVDFHKKILQVEDFLREQGFKELWGMSGGSCGLCRECGAKTGKPCPFPDEARMSIEAVGVDVLGMLEKLGQDNQFHPDKLTWTGCVLFKNAD